MLNFLRFILLKLNEFQKIWKEVAGVVIKKQKLLRRNLTFSLNLYFLRFFLKINK